jgi:uncharacterized protein (TIGR00730 family)
MNKSWRWRLKSVCVFCGSSDNVSSEYITAAGKMGRILAERGIRLVYGGGKTGLMGAVADGALAASGEVVGVIVTSMNTPALAHSGLSLMEVLPEMQARKARMYELAEGFIALPGGFGTFDELFETLTLGQIGEHEKPIGLLNVRNYYAALLAAIDHAVEEGFIFREHREVLYCDPEPQKLLYAMENHRHPHEAVKRWMRQS